MAVPATTAFVPVEEYLRTSYKPACEYIEGVLRQKPMPTSEHSELQLQIASLVGAADPRYLGLPELTLKIRPNKFLVPDIAIVLKEGRQRPYPTKPVHCCVEILSPEDRLAQVVGKCDEYLAWGVPTVWILDPETRRAWQYEVWPPTEVPPGGVLRAGDIAIPVDEIFSILDS